jgi:hypothetical protein
MPLSTGTRLGSYEILAPLGASGTGETWKARDTSLGRIVAIRVLAVEFDEFLKNEARAVIALNHPYICQLYEVGPNHLAMEYIESKQLAGPLPLDQALEYAIQVAEALVAAHEKGILHGNLKPANIMVTKSGVKVIDFGLAKMSVSAEAAAAGEVETLDTRSDILAFGALLFEMLTGRKASEDSSQALPASLAPAALNHFIRRCLAKDPNDRWQTARDLVLELIWIRESGAPSGATSDRPQPKLRRRLAWAGAAVLSAAAMIYGVLRLHQEKPAPALLRFTVATPENGSLQLYGRPSVSPDGQSVMFGVIDPASLNPVWYRHSFATGTSSKLPGTDKGIAVYWSSDGRSILLSRSNIFWRMDLNGGSQQRLPVVGAYTSWQPEGVISGGRQGLRWFRPDGSGLRWVKKRDDKNGIGYSYPSLIPGGRWLLYNTSGPGGASTGMSLHLASLDGKVDRPILSGDHAAIYAGPGYLLYLRGDTLTAQAIDPEVGQLRGGSAPIAGPVGTTAGITDQLGSFSASDNGVLAFRSAAITENRLLWLDRSGKSLGTLGGIAEYSNPTLSPDGNRLAIGIRDPATGKRNIWVLDLQRDTVSRATFDSGDDFTAVWSPDGTRIAFASDRRSERGLYVKNASGTGEEKLLFSSTIPKNVEDWSRDGRWIVFSESRRGGGTSLMLLSLESLKVQDFLHSRFVEDQARLSPDGKWIAYRSNESGRFELFIQALPPARGKWQISSAGGGEPQWRGDGKELFYSTLQDPARIMAVDISGGSGAIQAGIPHPLFDVRLPFGVLRNRLVVTGDGKKFLAIAPPEQKADNSFTVIVNWPSLLKKKK